MKCRTLACKQDPCGEWWHVQAAHNQDDPRNTGEWFFSYEPHVRPCNCYMHLDGLDAFDNQHQPLVDGYRDIVVQLLNGHVGRVDQVTGEMMESWIPTEVGIEKHQRMLKMQSTQPDPF